jgi:hypothetical protein
MVRQVLSGKIVRTGEQDIANYRMVGPAENSIPKRKNRYYTNKDRML